MEILSIFGRPSLPKIALLLYKELVDTMDICIFDDGVGCTHSGKKCEDCWVYKCLIEPDEE